MTENRRTNDKTQEEEFFERCRNKIPDKLKKLSDELKKLLLEDLNNLLKEVDIRIRNGKDGKTALMYAARYNRDPETITILLEALIEKYKKGEHVARDRIDAFINARDETGKTALILAAKWNNDPRVIMELLDAGADAALKDDDGRTAADYAEENENIKNTDAYWYLKDIHHYTLH